MCFSRREPSIAGISLVFLDMRDNVNDFKLHLFMKVSQNSSDNEKKRFVSSESEHFS